MRRCTRCGAVSPNTARTCQRCGASFQRPGPVQSSTRLRGTHPAPGTVSPKKKQRSFLIGLLALLGIRYDPQKGSWGCAFPAAIISVALVVVVVGGIIAGPVLKLIPPFAPGLTVIGTVAPGASVIVHGTNFPPGSHINLTLDGNSIALVPTPHRSISQGLYDLSLSVALANPLQQTEQPSASASDITVRNDGTFDAQISIPKSWQPNSQHVIQAQAIGQDGRAQAQVQQAVIMPGSGGNQGVSSSQGQSNTASTTSSGRSINISFSGSLSGPLVVSKVNSCGVSNGNYVVDVSGSINGTNYHVTISVGSYQGPGQYYTDPAGAAGGVGEVAISNPNNNGDRWGSLGQHGSVTVNSGEKSGSVSTPVLNPVSNGQAQVTGSWTCP